jgi:[ribosomal protein S18]-alanine N-acetyltransferase
MPDHLKNPVGDEDRKERCIFRESTAADETAIREILREANLSSYSCEGRSNDPPNEWGNKSGSTALPAIGSTFVYLCELNGEVVAVLQWRHLGQEAEILDVAVSARHRRKGYARLLLKNFLALVQKRGTSEIFLEVRESNVAALSLYREFAFGAAGRRPNYYRDPMEAALLLRLKITD